MVLSCINHINAGKAPTDDPTAVITIHSVDKGYSEGSVSIKCSELKRIQKSTSSATVNHSLYSALASKIIQDIL